MQIIIRMVNWVNCRLSFHETYSIANDLNFKFNKYHNEISKNTVDENVELFEELTAQRCRHCDYLFMPRKKDKT